MSGIPYRVERSTRTGWFGVAVLVLLVGGLLSVPAWAGRAEMRLLVEVCYYLALAASVESSRRLRGSRISGPTGLCRAGLLRISDFDGVSWTESTYCFATHRHARRNSLLSRYPLLRFACAELISQSEPGCWQKCCG